MLITLACPAPAHQQQYTHTTVPLWPPEGVSDTTTMAQYVLQTKCAQTK